MPDLGTINVDLVANASNFNAQIGSARQSLGGLEQQVKSVGVVGETVRKLILPVGGAILGAFAAKSALGEYAKSQLPGAKDFSKGIEASQKSLAKLGAAVGEYLAPAALRAAKLIKAIADPLTDLVRQFTAFSRSSAALLTQLGKNILAAFRPLLPTVAGWFDAIAGLFDGPKRDWAKALEDFRAEWNAVWQSVLEYTTPIFIEVANVVEAALHAAQEVAIEVFDAIKGVVGDVTEWLKSKIPEGAGASGKAFEGIGESIRQGIIFGLGLAEFAFKSWRDIGELAFVGVEYAAVTAFEVIAHSIDDLQENFSAFAEQLPPLFEAVGENIAEVLKASFESVAENFGVLMLRMKAKGEAFFHWLAYPSGINWRNFANDAVLKHAGGEFTSPDFSAVKPMPGIELPGFTDRDRSPQEEQLGQSLHEMTEALLEKFKTFAESPIGDEGAFIKAIQNALPQVNFTPVAATDLAASDKHAAAAIEGSKEAYSAILKATNGKDNIPVKQLAAQNLTNTKLDALNRKAFGFKGIGL
jgi:hypothetical protein